MRKPIVIAALAACLAGCGVVEPLVNGFKHAQAVEADLKEAIGIKPGVGFNWHNGRLVSVTVTFPRLYDAKPLRELADMTRAAVVKEFQQTPGTVVLAFQMGTEPGPTAQSTPTQ
jgi:hypothetical protein